MPTRPRSHSERLRAQRQRQHEDQAYNAQRRARDGPDPRSTARWRRLRLMQLARHPLCADPDGTHLGALLPATEVDHIQGVRLRPDLVFTEDNLQSLCGSCHARKSGRERRRVPPGFSQEVCEGIAKPQAIWGKGGGNI